MEECHCPEIGDDLLLRLTPLMLALIWFLYLNLYRLFLAHFCRMEPVGFRLC